VNKIFLLIIIFLMNICVASEVKGKKEKNLYSHYDVINHPKDNRNITNITLYYDKKNDFLTKEYFDVLQAIDFEVLEDFLGKDVCYIACVHKEKSFALDSKRYGNIVGFLKVKGEFEQEYCRPYGTKYEDYILNKEITQICNAYISLCADDKCIVNGNMNQVFRGMNK
jgi:hypothetical protein